MRYFIEIAYRGTHYHGWQLQENAHSVQAELNRALQTLLRQDIETTGSGRTDTGVHCRRQFVHFDAEEIKDRAKFLYSLNKCLPPDIHVADIRTVKAEASARFDAISRSYEYHIVQVKDPFALELAYYYGKQLDLALMNQAAGILFNYEDYESFSKVKTDVKHFKCKIYRAEWIQHDKRLVFYITANRFLRGMVRTIVGTLLDVGRGALSLQGFEQAIQQRDRTKAGRAVPPQGLYLVNVDYPEEIFPD